MKNTYKLVAIVYLNYIEIENFVKKTWKQAVSNKIFVNKFCTVDNFFTLLHNINNTDCEWFIIILLILIIGEHVTVTMIRFIRFCF